MGVGKVEVVDGPAPEDVYVTVTHRGLTGACTFPPHLVDALLRGERPDVAMETIVDLIEDIRGASTDP